MGTRLQFRLPWLFVIVTTIAVILSYRNMRFRYPVSTMSHADIVVDGSNLNLRGPAKQIVSDYGIKARRTLKSLLDDSERFAAAHVALVAITGVETGSTWHRGPGQFVYNRLAYTRDAQNQLCFVLAQNEHLRDWWHETVGDHLGIPIVGETTGRLCWMGDETVSSHADDGGAFDLYLRIDEKP